MNIQYMLARLLKKAKPNAVLESHIGRSASIGHDTQFVRSSIGRYSYIGNGSSIVETDIGAFCSIGGSTMIGGGGHPIEWVSTSPVFFSGRNALNTNFALSEYSPYCRTIIGNDVWLGAGVKIKGGVRIGSGAVIGMGSIVTHDVQPYEIWAGNPARFIRKRFNETVIRQLLESEWWTWDEKRIAGCAEKMKNPEEFLNEFCRE